MKATEIFTLILIKPTRYDDDGYPIIWIKPLLASSSLATLNGLAADCRDRKILGSDIDINILIIDETTQRVSAEKLIRNIRNTGGKALIGLVGVQSNQFPRAIDIARPFCEEKIPVCIGGFHVSGCHAMLEETPPEIAKAIDMGISLFIGEAEEQRLDQVIIDASKNIQRQVYDFSNSAPSLEDQPYPVLPEDVAQRTRQGAFDLGRGCPFVCSFCCIINVQGHKSRFRTADDLEQTLRYNHSIGMHELFIADDNFARNKNWEAYMDRIIELRELENIKVSLLIQVDTACHKIPGFIKKCAQAGVEGVFIGMENINPDNLLAAGKRQNNIVEYREMMLEWKRHHIFIVAGNIIGFPRETPESLARDIDIIMSELPIDMLSSTYLTPLPGSEDHKNMLEHGEWMDPDLNKYDLTHRVTKHPLMSDNEWENAFRNTYLKFSSFKHIKTVLRRNAALGSGRKYKTALGLFGTRMAAYIYGSITYDLGHFRLKYRKDRRPGLPIEGPLKFYTKYFIFSLSKYIQVIFTYHYIRWLAKRIFNDQNRLEYTDKAIAPVSKADLNALDMFSETAGGQAAIVKFHKKEEIRKRVKEKVRQSSNAVS